MDIWSLELYESSKKIRKSKFCFESVNIFYLNPEKKILQGFKSLYAHIGAYLSEIKEELNKPR